MSRRPRLLLAPTLVAIVAASLPGCGEPNVDLTVNVERELGATFLTPPSLKVLVRAQCQQPEIWGPYELDEENQRYYIKAEVPPDTPFSVDIWGCATATSCDELTARGCTLVSSGISEDDEGRAITIELRDFDRETDPCSSIDLDMSTCGVGP